MAKSVEPLYERVAVEPLEQEEKTQGGIIIPDTVKDKPIRGTVVAVGCGYRSDDGKILPLMVKVGDLVTYAKWGGNEIELNGKKVVILKESDILAVMRD
ncbi:co-chaperone GroES [Candidatus Sneabacter namystus]|uniref:Co-chaperonin GroES n=1 Tax=Candidatus Sneabacter namystus TaxID=2601646 RepID=A0A5C0UHX7_9RICK|nr:co-chaperone GroES [Candidatus Sneabacter namystus]QEK39367.1 co-chaperone GroES [Candidatus Sneabacter namystus]